MEIASHCVDKRRNEVRIGNFMAGYIILYFCQGYVNALTWSAGAIVSCDCS